MQKLRLAGFWLISIAIVLSFYRFRWGVLGVVGIGPPYEACSDIEALETYLDTGGSPSAYLWRTPLIVCAAGEGNYQVVSRLIEVGVDLNASTRRPYIPIFKGDGAGFTALHASLNYEHLDITRLLFEHGANANLETESRLRSPLNHAISLNQIDAVQLFLGHSDIVYELDQDLFWQVGRSENLDLLKVILETDIVCGQACEVALLSAAQKGHLKVVDFLLSKGVPIDSRASRKKQAALHLATSSERFEVMKFLIKMGVDIDAVDERGDTPLHYAARNNSSEAARLLIEHGADRYRENRVYDTPMDVAIKYESLDVLNLLKQEGNSI